MLENANLFNEGAGKFLLSFLNKLILSPLQSEITSKIKHLFKHFFSNNKATSDPSRKFLLSCKEKLKQAEENRSSGKLLPAALCTEYLAGYGFITCLCLCCCGQSCLVQTTQYFCLMWWSLCRIRHLYIHKFFLREER